MEEKTEFIVRFDGISEAEANKFARDLQSELRSAGITASRERTESASQDFGATLVLVLGTPVVVEVARALHAWAVRKNAASLVIEDRNRRLVASNIESRDAPALAEAFRKGMVQPK